MNADDPVQDLLTQARKSFPPDHPPTQAELGKRLDKIRQQNESDFTRQIETLQQAKSRLFAERAVRLPTTDAAPPDPCAGDPLFNAQILEYRNKMKSGEKSAKDLETSIKNNHSTADEREQATAALAMAKLPLTPWNLRLRGSTEGELVDKPATINYTRVNGKGGTQDGWSADAALSLTRWIGSTNYLPGDSSHELSVTAEGHVLDTIDPTDQGAKNTVAGHIGLQGFFSHESGASLALFDGISYQLDAKYLYNRNTHGSKLIGRADYEPHVCSSTLKIGSWMDLDNVPVSLLVVPGLGFEAGATLDSGRNTAATPDPESGTVFRPLAKLGVIFSPKACKDWLRISITDTVRLVSAENFGAFNFLTAAIEIKPTDYWSISAQYEYGYDGDRLTERTDTLKVGFGLKF
jgi:hypothetical protein